MRWYPEIQLPLIGYGSRPYDLQINQVNETHEPYNLRINQVKSTLGLRRSKPAKKIIKKRKIYLLWMCGVWMAGVSGSFESLFEIELRCNVSSDSIADEAARRGDIRADRLVFPGHIFSDWRGKVRNPRIQEGETSNCQTKNPSKRRELVLWKGF